MPTLKQYSRMITRTSADKSMKEGVVPARLEDVLDEAGEATGLAVEGEGGGNALSVDWAAMTP